MRRLPMFEREKVRGIVRIHRPTEKHSNERHRIASRDHREQFLTWLATEGKDPDELQGYAEDTCYEPRFDARNQHGEGMKRAIYGV